MTHSLTDRAVTLLAQWAPAAERFWNPVVGDDTMGCYGPGYIHWGVQSNWNYAAAMATLAAQPDTPNADHWRDRALAALRFALATHVTGDRTGNDGRQWGHSWISMLGIERGIHGVALLEDALTATDHAALRRVLTAEASWLLHDARRGDAAGLVAGLWNSSGHNVPESNIWSGALLWRTAQRYPDAPEAAAWRERAHDYFVNGVSIPADATDATLVAGQPVSARHVGANFFPNFALDHHGYLNVGYMVICVSNAAMLYFDMHRAGMPVPESLMHHQADLWQVLRRMIFGNGRLARIGGDSRVRYAYCQEYLLPSLLFAAAALGDAHALDLAAQQLGLIEQELAASDDGTFYGARMGAMRDVNPHYYTRLESDRACVLSMLAHYLALVAASPTPQQTFEASVAGGWAEPEHGAALHRSPTRLASFAWRARGLTQALCLPPSDPQAISTAEWSLNLAPVVRFLGDEGGDDGAHRRLLRQTVQTFPGGFATCGAVMEGVDVHIDEGGHCTDQAVTHLAFAALPDDRTCVGLQLVVAAPDRLGYVVEVRGLHLNVANDVLNNRQRIIRDASGEHVLVAPPAHDEVVLIDGMWLSVDEILGLQVLYGAERLLIGRSHERQGGRYHSQYVEEIWALPPRPAGPGGVFGGRGRYYGFFGGWRRPRPVQPGEVLVDLGYAVLAGASGEVTAATAGGPLSLGTEEAPALVRGVWVAGADGQRYAVVANFGDVPTTVPVAGESLEVAPGTCRVHTFSTDL